MIEVSKRLSLYFNSEHHDYVTHLYFYEATQYRSSEYCAITITGVYTYRNEV